MENKDRLSRKILIIHDRFQFRGGAERLVLILAKALPADILTEFWTSESFPQIEAPGEVFVLTAAAPRTIVWRYFRAQMNYFCQTKKFSQNYDLVIFSGNNCLTAAFNFGKNVPKIYYCHSPVRYVYDLLDYRKNQETSFGKRFFFYDLGKHLIRFIYRRGLARMDKVLANSRNVQARLKKFCQTDSEVVYPPIETGKFAWRGQGDYYLSFGRLDELKRVQDIVRAFAKMPDKKLIVCSGGAAEEQIRNLASRYSNIEIRGWVDDQELANLVGNCIASIYLPIDEDFGMTPLESMSAGKPVIGVAAGGLKETIIDKKTGRLIPADYQLSDLISAVEYLSPDRALQMKYDCSRRAQDFSADKFIAQMKKIIEFKLL